MTTNNDYYTFNMNINIWEGFFETKKLMIDVHKHK